MTAVRSLEAVRALIGRSLEHPTLLDRLGDDDDFARAGIGSGELIRIALSLEDELARPLGDEELLGLTSVRAVAAVLGAGEAG
ncbi:phosphopantetheine-binding protein [Streptomyces sp. FXJ1.172]|uniref:phosphopantetheine-binding protein n=1 Tax=Streptomyces sp. FXJ1.172 TaxID=710705 RepID=UPI0007CF4639|nr:phosphopantetheine-binding protein [Streptomyces sp. FXJ1.172]WEO94221.1 phosphopantetheine-binding protein [Streptomyces sp. FXJ1.172]